MIVRHARRLAKRVDEFTLRERVLIFASTLVAILLGWYQFGMVPLLASQKAALTGIDEARQRIEAADAAVSAQARALGVSGVSTVEAQIEQVRRRGDEIQALIDARTAEIIDPATMAEILEDVLARQRGLRLIRARNLDAERLPQSDDDAPLFRHTLRLELEGPYLTVLAYLDDLESLPWRIYWQGIEIDARDYPRNRVQIDVSTLSFDEDWIGV